MLIAFSEAYLGLLQHPSWSTLLTTITKRSILDIAAVLDAPLVLLQIVVLKITLHKKEFPADLVTFTEEILNEKLHFLRSVSIKLCSTSLKAY